MAQAGVGDTVSPPVDFDFYCTECDVYENAETIATAYCEKCSEYLCNDCLGAHKRLPVPKSHRIVGIDKLPKRIGSGIKSTLTERCDRHGGETIHFYCTMHNEMCCPACIRSDHRRCAGVMKYIPDISSKFLGQPETDSAMVDISSLVERFETVREEGQCSLRHLDVCKKKSLNALRRIRESFEQLERKARSEIDKFYAFECDKIVKQKTDCDSALNALKDEQKKFEELLKSGDTNRLFVSVKKIANEANVYNETLRRIHKYNTEVDFGFEEGSLVTKLFDSDVGLGKLCTSERYTCVAPLRCTCTKPYGNRQAVLFKEFAVKAKGKAGSRLRVFGAEVLPNGHLLMHCEFNMVKVFDPYCRPLTSIILEACPNDMTVLDNNSAVVTMPLLKKLQFLSIELRLKKERYLRTNKPCYGVAYIPVTEGRLAVAVGYKETAEVQILDLYGAVKIRIHDGPNDKKLFTFPEFVTVGGNKLIYVTDSEHHTVTCVKLDGSLVAVYRDKDLKYPCGPAVDPEGNFYVAGNYTNNIDQVDLKGQKIRTLLSESDGIQLPRSLCLDNKNDLLIVPFGDPGTVRIYKLLLVV